jgi:adiponectin receptor
MTCRFDYLGIVVPLWGTTISSTYFGFNCEPFLQDVYRALATLAGILCAITTFHPAFSGTSGRKFRTSMYCLLGLFSFLPIVHGVILHGLSEHDRRMSLMHYLGLGACHSTGAMLYAARIPEKWYPRTFDIAGSSHQLMHSFVVLGAICYGIGILKAYDFWQDPSRAKCF